MLTRRESQSRCSLVWKKTGCDVSHQQFHRLVKPRSPHQHSCCRAVLNSCDTVSCRKVSLMTCFSSRAIASNSLVSVVVRRVNPRITTRLISVTSAFSTAFTSVLGASRVALQLGCCVLLTKGCDQRGILQHLLSALLLLLTGVAGAVSSDCFIEGVLLSSSSDDSLSGGAVRLTVSVSVLQQP